VKLKMLLSLAVLMLIPTIAMAGLLGEILDPILNPGGGTVAPIPEPSGALIMAVALGTVALVKRRSR
jgi:hypothetical protein